MGVLFERIKNVISGNGDKVRSRIIRKKINEIDKFLMKEDVYVLYDIHNVQNILEDIIKHYEDNGFHVYNNTDHLISHVLIKK